MRIVWIILLAVTIVVVISWNSMGTNVKAFLFISQGFPQIPVKPLSWFTKEPETERVEFGEKQEIVADLVLPASPAGGPQKGEKHPAIIFAMGVYTQEKDRVLLLDVADTFARSGYIILWPRSKILDKEEGILEGPQIFVESFKYLESRNEIDKERISFLGFSLGSSIAMVAAEDPEIAGKVRSLVWFGGYYSLYDYLTSLAVRQFVVQGRTVGWEPHEGATSHAEKIMKPKGGSLELFKGNKVTEEQKAYLARFSPDAKLDNFRARLLILHDKNDSYVPWVESQKLKQAMDEERVVAYHITDLFGHVQPKDGGINWGVAKELWNMYRFVYKVFSAL